MESALRPRDIQSRIRAGESAEDVAAVAGTSVEKVMIFASPVLAERAHVAQSAESASVRRTTTDPASPAVATTRTLGAAVAVRLREVGVDPEGVEWDSWRREDGRWTLQAGYHHDQADRRARFSFDQRGHFVAADDDEARWLVGDGQVPARAPRPSAVPGAAPGLRLAPSYTEPVLPDPAPDGPTVREPARTTSPHRERASAAAIGDDTLDLFTADADWMTALPDAAGTPVADADADEATSLEEDRVDATAPVEPDAEAAPEAPRTMLPQPSERTTPRAHSKKARGRASVPSWDEIMFGGGK